LDLRRPGSLYPRAGPAGWQSDQAAGARQGCKWHRSRPKPKSRSAG